MTRPFLFGTNFKMNQTPAESAAFFGALAEKVAAPDGVQLFVIPPFTSLPAVTALDVAAKSGIWIGAQNMHWAADGAYTGEISAAMLQALGVDLVLLGHAERRRLFHETDQDVNRKVLTAVERGLRVLLCVGETAEERGYGVGGETVARQLTIGLHDLDPKHLPLLQIAYEPVWCIGAGSAAAHPSDVAPIVRLIRDVVGTRFGESGRAVPVLYGGSVDPANAAGFVRLPDIDGLFVGRAAWTVDGFRATLDAALRARFGDGLG
ncbi:MAG TPA: triose-phosphate isomerase [Thermomicrobiales bacterium]|nr:triose-phosphate isomerase [Thermomicrobiales bacterium]